MTYELPVTAPVDGREIPIRADFRVILDIIECMQDPDLSDADKAEGVVVMFYPDADEILDLPEALRFLLWFVGGGQDRQDDASPRLVDWEHDFPYIIAPVNRVMGYDVRAVPYDIEKNEGGVHWWSFLSAYMEIGADCLMSQIVSIRDKKARSRKLEKPEREWYSRNRRLVDLPSRYSAMEDELCRMIGGVTNEL